jgi:hypothetical protein
VFGGLIKHNSCAGAVKRDQADRKRFLLPVTSGPGERRVRAPPTGGAGTGGRAATAGDLRGKAGATPEPSRTKPRAGTSRGSITCGIGVLQEQRR